MTTTTTDKPEFFYQRQSDAAAALGVTEEQLKQFKEQPWFPPLGWVNGKGWCVELISAAKAFGSSDITEQLLIERRKFTPACPKSKHHSARVSRVRGRIRECVCSDCGHTWSQVGEYPDIRSETLSRIVKFLESAGRSTFKHPETGEPVKVILIEDQTVLDWIKFCRGAIAAKQ